MPSDESGTLVDLTVQGLSWCMHHGHPILRLEAGDREHGFWITLSPEDAQVLSPLHSGCSVGRARLYDLMLTVLESSATQLRCVTLTLGHDTVLRASLLFDGPFGPFTRTAHTVDAVLLAWRCGLAVRIDALDLRRICDPVRHPPSGYAGEVGGAAAAVDPPEPIRRFIESLDFGAIDERGMA